MRALPAMFGPLLLAACGQSASDAPLEATLGGQPARGRLVIHVDDDAAPGGDGSGRFPFDDIADAVALAECAPRSSSNQGDTR